MRLIGTGPKFIFVLSKHIKQAAQRIHLHLFVNLYSNAISTEIFLQNVHKIHINGNSALQIHQIWDARRQFAMLFDSVIANSAKLSVYFWK